ncbi:hypothetical protein RCL_jg11785.t1 [Rhizophagus clarus]|uniref:Uncharacterized protein n=1 Tax=Rhizophagus clarus TaxID=94130 RepID=A0A8H3MDN7_9GLOM|nr:hypothetical protein RCL_jg11785.t1 [Rhizophagus clarus]
MCRNIIPLATPYDLGYNLNCNLTASQRSQLVPPSHNTCESRLENDDSGGSDTSPSENNNMAGRLGEVEDDIRGIYG